MQKEKTWYRKEECTAVPLPPPTCTGRLYTIYLYTLRTIRTKIGVFLEMRALTTKVLRTMLCGERNFSDNAAVSSSLAEFSTFPLPGRSYWHLPRFL